MKKNVWIINQYAGAPKYGMNFRSYYIAKELVSQDYNVTVFSGSFTHLLKKYPIVKDTFTKEDIDGIGYVWVKLSRYRGSKSLGRLFSMLVFAFKLLFFRRQMHRLEKPDIIIISSLSLFPVLNAYIWSKFFKIRFIFEVRDIWPLTLMALGNVSKYNILVLVLGLIEKFGYKKAKYVVSLLPLANIHMEKRGLNLAKYKYIPNGINLDELTNPKLLSRDISTQIPSNKFIVGYTGTIGIANALEYLIEAASLLKENIHIHFVIVGHGGEKEKLQIKTKLLCLENVTFIDAVEKTEVQSMLNLFDVCYIGWHKHILYQYGISANKIFEYMYSETPIVHSVEAGNDPVKESGCGISVAPENVEEIALGIEKIYHLNENDRKKMGENGRKYILKHHVYSHLVKEYIRLIEN